ncbi:MAG TPA: alkaline phosphatase D family protein [Solirubrobacteraceae bacterium]|nr:alkaline phosphatase D family protein [Solirubrobacteraceae bacterium]
MVGNWDNRISRRTLLRTGGTLAAGLVLFDRSALRADASPPFEGFPFPLGVASGDLTADSVVLWTRLAPLGLDGTGMPDEAYSVRYEVATDPEFARIVRSGTEVAVPDEVHSVHAEVGGLQPDTVYWYRFKWGATESRVGRTRTAPLPSETPDPLRFAFVSCQNYTHGYFTAYADLVQQDLDFVVHLGDYIYEGPGLIPAVRAHLPAATLMSLSDYRTRHAQYRTDTDLQTAHATVPFVMTWDDHEFKNNYGDLDVDEPATPLEDVAARRAAAYLAYWEHAPLARARKPVGEDLPLYRRIDWGSLARFHVLDTRQYRSVRAVQCSAARRDPESGYCPAWLDPARVMLGAQQRDWLFKNLGGSRASWNVLANQVPFAPEDNLAGFQRRFFPDRWDGFVAERQRVLDFIAEHGLGNVVAITGDSHVNAVRNVPGSFRSMDSQPVATEFVGTSISTNGDTPPDTSYGGDPDNPHHLFYSDRRGYVIVDADPQRWTSTFRVMQSVTVPQSPVSTVATFAVEQGSPGAYRL